MNHAKRRASLMKRKERIDAILLPYRQEMEFIDAQLALIDEYEKVRRENNPELFDPEPDEGEP